MLLNIESDKKHSYDAIVVGSGISGGYAAKELCEKGLKVLLLERGPDQPHIESYEHALKSPWEMPHRGTLTNKDKSDFPIQSKEGSYPINEYNKQFWMPFEESPYEQKRPFEWYRGKGVGGKSLLWGRQVYRWSDVDFEANLKEERGTDWPVRYKEIKDWYSKVERFMGVSGEALGLSHIPDSIFQPAMEMNCVEKTVKERLKKSFPNRVMTIGRAAHITKATKEQLALGRGSCQYRDACSKGCPYGAYFSSQSASLPAAMRTGNLTIRPYSVVKNIDINAETGKAKGVTIVDTESKEEIHFTSKMIFLNASTVATAQILLNSTSSLHPNGLGNNSDQVGRNFMDHHSRVGARGQWEGNKDDYYFGRRANGIFIPRYRNLGSDKRNYLGGFDFQGGAARSGWNQGNRSPEIGESLKNKITQPGSWSMMLYGFGETLPYENNRVTIDSSQTDKYGLPKIVVDAAIGENEQKMRKEMASDAAEMLESVGLKNVSSFNKENFPLGLSKHEMGTARMGNDPGNSVVNKYNQIWDCKNVFITDGSFMASSGCVNPSLTYLAFTARAADFAVSESKKLNL